MSFSAYGRLSYAAAALAHIVSAPNGTSSACSTEAILGACGRSRRDARYRGGLGLVRLVHLDQQHLGMALPGQRIAEGVLFQLLAEAQRHPLLLRGRKVLLAREQYAEVPQRRAQLRRGFLVQIREVQALDGGADLRRGRNRPEMPELASRVRLATAVSSGKRQGGSELSNQAP